VWTSLFTIIVERQREAAAEASALAEGENEAADPFDDLPDDIEVRLRSSVLSL
jgi:hypothetical protein